MTTAKERFAGVGAWVSKELNDDHMHTLYWLQVMDRLEFTEGQEAQKARYLDWLETHDRNTCEKCNPPPPVAPADYSNIGEMFEALRVDNLHILQKAVERRMRVSGVVFEAQVEMMVKCVGHIARYWPQLLNRGGAELWEAIQPAYDQLVTKMEDQLRLHKDFQAAAHQPPEGMGR